MKVTEFKGLPRSRQGKKETVRIRRQGRVPCVLYGGEKNVSFSLDSNELKKIVHTHDVYLFKIDLDGDIYEAVVQDIQFHPVTDEIIHMDFLQVFGDRKVSLSLPIELTGSSVGIKGGGKLRQRRREIRVKGFLKDMPERLEIDMTPMDVGDFLKISDLEFENLEILDPPRAMVVGVVSSRLVAKGLREAVVEEEAAEEEVIEEVVEKEEAPEVPETPEETSSKEE